MNPSNRVLEHNLQLLLERCYRPVVPSREFVGRLEAELAPWLEEPRARGSRRDLRPLWGTLLAAAAVLLAWLVLDLGRGPGSQGLAPGLEERLSLGDVAVREGLGAWRSARPEELLTGLAWRGSVLEVATPEGRAARVHGEAGWSVELQPSSRVSVRGGSAGPHFRLERGGARALAGIEALEFRAPSEFSWDGSGFHGFLAGDAATLVEGGAERASVEAAPGGGGPATEDELDRVHTATIRGHALEAGGGEPLEVFEVSLLRAVSLPQVSAPETTRFVAAGGEFQLDGLTPGQYSLFLQSPGHAVWRRSDLTLGPGDVLDLEARVEVGVSLSGFVVDRDTGAAVAGALVVAERDLPMQVVSMTLDEFPEVARAYTHTAADGSFVLEHLSSGVQRLRANGPHHAPGWTEDLELVSDVGRDDVLIELGPGGGVHGLVQREDGEVWSQARVIISRFDPTGGAGTMTYQGLWTDAEGRYSVENLTPGYHVVLLFGDVQSEEEIGDPVYSSVRIREGEMAEVNFLVSDTSCTLRGVVRDGDGVPLAGVNLRLHRGGGDFRAGLTDESGVYSIEVEEPGRYLLFAGRNDSSMRVAKLDLKAGQEFEHDVVLTGATVRVDLRDVETSTRLAGASVMLLPGRATSRTQLADLDEMIGRTWRGASGDYLLEDVPAGEYDLLVILEDGEHATTLVEEVQVAQPPATTRLDLPLERAGRVGVEVVDESGAPIQGARVQLVHPHGRRWAFNQSMRTNAAGQLSVPGLLPGTWECRVRAAGFEKGSTEFDVDAGLEGRARVVLVRR